MQLEAQSIKKFESMTKAEVLKMSYEELTDLPLDDLMKLASIVGVSTDELLSMILNTKTSVASNKELTTREAPGILSVIAADDIKKSGARDLIDVLNLLPGFNPGVDVESVIGLGLRGVWGHEGKILLRIDGQEMNELSYQTLQFGNHFDVNQISRIEVIRGPGSAMYGGNAELGVINIITKSGNELDGTQIHVSGCMSENGINRSNLHLSTGKKNNNWEFSLHGFIGKGYKGDGIATDYYGTSYNMDDASSSNPLHLNIGASFKNLSFRFISDMYNTTQLDGFGGYFNSEIYEPIKTSYKSVLSELRYDMRVNDKLTNVTKINYRWYDSYRVEMDDLIQEYLDEEHVNYNEDYFYSIQEKPTQRISVHNSIKYQPMSSVDIHAGVEAYHEEGRSENEWIPYYDENGNEIMSLKYQNISGFFQSVIETKQVNVIAGARFEYHTLAGSSFVPRVGLTKVFNKLHFKALYSNAYRSPSIEAFSLNRNIKPENTTVIEFETGYVLSKNIFFSVNLFDNTIYKPIVYIIDESSSLGESYINGDKTGSQGVESEIKLVSNNWGYLFLNYSYYTTGEKNKVGDYQVFLGDKPEEKIVLGFPSHKISGMGHWNVADDFSINPSFVYMSDIYGVSSISEDVNGEEIYHYNKFAGQFLLNVNLLYENIFTKGFDISLGVYDLLNEKQKIYQAYVARPALMLNGRSLQLILGYSF